MYFCCLSITSVILISLGKTPRWIATVGIVIAVLVWAIIIFDDWYNALRWRKRRGKNAWRFTEGRPGGAVGQFGPQWRAAIGELIVQQQRHSLTTYDNKIITSQTCS